MTACTLNPTLDQAPSVQTLTTPPPGVSFQQVPVLAQHKAAYERALREYNEFAAKVESHGFTVAPINLPTIDYSLPLPEILSTMDLSVKMAQDQIRTLAKYNVTLAKMDEENRMINDYVQRYMNQASQEEPEVETSRIGVRVIYRVRSEESQQNEINATINQVAAAALITHAVFGGGLGTLIQAAIAYSLFKYCVMGK